MQAHVTHLPHRVLLRVTGSDWAPFLKGLCTAHIDVLAAESSAGIRDRLHYGAFLRPQGKMYADVMLSALAADDIRLDVPLSASDELLAKLNMYKLRARVTIEAMDTPVFAAFGGELPEGFMVDPRAVITGGRYGRAYGGRASGDGDWRHFRMAMGLAEAGEDFGKDELYAIDANLDLLGAIDFHKGCYVGQELTSRMKRRGQIKSRILPLRHDGKLERGQEVLNGDLRAGEVLSSADGCSLALMRLDRLGALTVGGQMVEAKIPGWLRPANTTSV